MDELLICNKHRSSKHETTRCRVPSYEVQEQTKLVYAAKSLDSVPFGEMQQKLGM